MEDSEDSSGSDFEEELARGMSKRAQRSRARPKQSPSSKLASLKQRKSLEKTKAERFAFETKFVSKVPTEGVNLSESSDDDDSAAQVVARPLQAPKPVMCHKPVVETPIFESPLKDDSQILHPKHDDHEMASQLENLAKSYSEITDKHRQEEQGDWPEA